MTPNFEGFYKKAKNIFKNRIYNDYLRRFCYGVEASCYRYIPELVISVENEFEVMKAIELSKEFNTPLCFRAAGTSLSGQAACKDILVILNLPLNWQNIKLKNNDSIFLDCGVIGSNANVALKKFHKKIGPDPASINAAFIGGIVANNSSGMCCGVRDNSYNTLKSIRVILSDGALLATNNPDNVANFLKSHSKMIKEIMQLREEILADKELLNLIKRKYKIKNTTGYSLNALIDFEDPIEIISHLFVGSEGTIGFISQVELLCVDDRQFKACALLFYNDILEASRIIETLVSLGKIITSAEIMDYASLSAAQKFEGMPKVISEIKEGNACILIQSESDNLDSLHKQIEIIKESISYLPSCLPIYFSAEANEYESWWKIRKGLFPIAASSKRKGDSVIIEDICFEIKDLGMGILAIQKLFKKYKFKNAIIFGHALEGNIHFIITPNLKNEFLNFAAFVEEMSIVVANFGGSIKAEHGTGRMIAPFVELEWGAKAYAINKKIKNIFDPMNLFNPDVIISNDKDIFKKNIKELNEVEDFIESCIECGFCERACPSNGLTLTPRQRIALQREIARLKDEPLGIELKEKAKYFLVETCATCSMCEELCPVGINAGTIASNFNIAKQGIVTKGIAKYIYNNFNASLEKAKFSLNIASKINSENKKNMSFKAKKIIKSIPVIREVMPLSNKFELKNKTLNVDSKSKTLQVDAIYFSSCLNRTFAPPKETKDCRSLQEVVENLCFKAKVKIYYPLELKNMCCGKAFANFPKIKEENLKKNIDILKNLSENFKIPIIFDHGACSLEGYKELTKYKFKVMDLSYFLLNFVAPKLEIKKSNENIGLYTMCSSKKMGLENVMLELAKLCTDGEILIDSKTSCCGFAGYKGFFTPELNIHATKSISKFYNENYTKIGFSNSSTCELGLNEATKFSWQHIAYFLDSRS